MTSTKTAQIQLPATHQGPQGGGARCEASVSTSPGAHEDEEGLAFMERTLRVAEGDPGLKLSRIDVKPGCKIGDNFASVVTRETSYGVRGDGSAYCRSVMVKRAPSAVAARDVFRCREAFRKEADAYSEWVPAMRRLCALPHVAPAPAAPPAASPAVPVPLPHCFHASHSNHPDTIVLQDMGPLGFRMGERRVGLDADHALLVMEALGRFHGVSLALRRTDPEAFRRLRARLHEIIYTPESESVFGDSIQTAVSLAVLSLRGAGRADLADRLEARAPSAFREMCDVVLPPRDEEGAALEPAITHGDCWINNLLFRYDKDGRVEDIRLLDLALLRCSSPVLDILHFFYTSLTRQVRKNNQDVLLRRYQQSLRDTVQDLVQANKRFSPGLPDQTPREGVSDVSLVEVADFQTPSLEVLHAELKKRAVYGLWHGLWMLPAIFYDPETHPQNDPTGNQNDLLVRWCKSLEMPYHTRLMHIVEEYAELGFL